MLAIWLYADDNDRQSNFEFHVGWKEKIWIFGRPEA